jgi:hypothetical protein
MTILTTSRKRRGGKDNPVAGGPTCGAVSAGRVEPTSATLYAVCSGTDRLSAYRIDGNSFEGFDSRGRSLGLIATERECLDVIERGAP